MFSFKDDPNKKKLPVSKLFILLFLHHLLLKDQLFERLICSLFSFCCSSLDLIMTLHSQQLSVLLQKVLVIQIILKLKIKNVFHAAHV